MSSLSHPFGVVYLIDNIISHTIYIGMTTRATRHRWQHHRYMLNHNRHDNPYLQRAWNKYGAKAFEFLVVEEAETEAALNEAECFWIAYLRSIGARLYNQKTGGGFGGKWSEAMRQKASASKMGKGKSAETRQRMSDAMRGVKKVITPEGYQRILERNRKPRSEETKQKNRAANLGRKAPLDEVTRSRETYAARHGSTYHLVSPDGTQYTTRRLRPFCEEHGLSFYNIKNALYGYGISHQGWTGYVERLNTET